MPRALRVWFPGAWYHVIARGNNKEKVFFAERDYVKYVRLLRDATKRFGLRVHAYALMPNHIHLMVETGDHHPIGKFIQWVHTTYTGYANFRYKRVGRLFQGRYKSLLIDRDAYALVLSRYIHLNPVRANLVLDPSDYRWTSYQAYCNPSGKSVVTTEWVLGLMSPHPSEQVRFYQQFVMGSDPTLENCEVSALGSDPSHGVKK